MQLINPDSFRLLEGAPKIRRQFLDWGVFHVEPRFMAAWQRLQKALRQRNSWLRHGTLDAASQAAWDRELCLASAEIDEYRRNYIKALKPVFERTLSELVELDGLTLSYYRGWDKDRELNEVLASSLHRDQQMGHTQAGPQRADLRLRIGANNAADILSRGQQNLWCVHCASPKATWSAKPVAVSVSISWMTCRPNWTSSTAAHYAACLKNYAARFSSPV